MKRLRFGVGNADDIKGDAQISPCFMPRFTPLGGNVRFTQCPSVFQRSLKCGRELVNLGPFLSETGVNARQDKCDTVLG